MIKCSIRPFLVALALFAAPSAAVSQTPAPETQPSPEAERLEALFNEMQSVGQQIGPMQEAALQDSTVRAAEEALNADLLVAMALIDPTIKDRMARLSAMGTEIGAAQAAGNGELFSQLMNERQGIQQHLMTVRDSALAEPVLAAKVEGFRKQIELKILEMNPGAQSLITRLHELEVLIGQAMGSGA